MLVGDERFAAFGDPLHRSAEELRGERRERVLGIEAALHPEPAADVLRNDAELGLGDLEDVAGDEAADHVRALDGAPQGVAILAWIMVGEAPARLERVGGEPAD